MMNEQRKESYDTQQELIDSIRLMLDNVDESLEEYQVETKNNLKQLLELNEKNIKLYAELESKLDNVLHKSADMMADNKIENNSKLW